MTVLSRVKSLLRQGLLVGCFAVGLMLLALFAFCLMPLKYTTLKAVTEAALPWLLLVTYVLVGVALVFRHRYLLALGTLLIAGHLVILSFEYRPSSSLPKKEPIARFTLLSHNLHYDNWDLPRFERMVHESDADIVLLQEYSRRDLNLVEEDGELGSYPYTYQHVASGPESLSVYSRFPLREQEVRDITGFPQMRVVASLGNYDVAIWNVHAHSPVEGNVRQWESDLQHLGKWIREEHLPVVMAGDFNATMQHRPFREIVQDGVREAAQDRGKWFDATWPSVDVAIPTPRGVLRLDHVLTKGPLRVDRIWTGSPAGSDHYSVHATINLYDMATES